MGVWHIVRMYLKKVVIVLWRLFFGHFYSQIFGGVAAIEVDLILESAESGQKVH